MNSDAVSQKLGNNFSQTQKQLDTAFDTFDTNFTNFEKVMAIANYRENYNLQDQ